MQEYNGIFHNDDQTIEIWQELINKMVEAKELKIPKNFKVTANDMSLLNALLQINNISLQRMLLHLGIYKIEFPGFPEKLLKILGFEETANQLETFKVLLFIQAVKNFFTIKSFV